MEALALSLMMWLQVNCSVPGISPEHDLCKLNYNVPVPKVEVVSRRELYKEYSGADAPSINGGFTAFYRYSTKTIWLQEDDYHNDMIAKTTLMHEIVHYLHHMNGMDNTGCLAELEISAYKTVQHIYNKMYGLYADVSGHIRHYIGNACNRMY